MDRRCHITNVFCPTGTGLSGGAVAGIVIGVLAGLTLLGAVGWLFIKGRFSTTSDGPLVNPPESDSAQIQNAFDRPYDNDENEA